MTGEPFPGKVIEWLLGRILSVARREEIIGDLIEEARTCVLPRRGRFLARLWLLREAARSLLRLVSLGGIWTGAAGGSSLSDTFPIRTRDDCFQCGPRFRTRGERGSPVGSRLRSIWT
jgi:hypothetical protein